MTNRQAALAERTVMGLVVAAAAVCVSFVAIYVYLSDFRAIFN